MRGVLEKPPCRATRRAVWLPLLLLAVSMWLLSGCVVTPIAAQQGSTEGAAVTIAVAPISGGPGMTIFVSGAGWLPNEVVYVNLEAAPDTESVQTTVAIATADGEGRFTASFPYPLDPTWAEPGMVQIVAYSLESGARATAPFEVVAASPTPTPAATATGVATTTTTPTPTAATPGNIGTVVSSALNVRSGPSTLFPVRRSITRGTEFLVLGQNSSGAWLLVRLAEGFEGWLARAYTNYAGAAPIVATPTPPATTVTPTPTPVFVTGWRGEYYNNTSLAGTPKLVRDDARVDFDWGYASPGARIVADNFSARWVQSINLPTGTYRFHAKADDGVRVWVNGDLVIDEWHTATANTYSAEKYLTDGNQLIRVEFFEATQVASVHFWYETTDVYPDWHGAYYSNPNLSGSPAFERSDPSIDFNWGLSAPANNFPANNFSVRWTRDVHFDAGWYRFHATMDDGMRVYLDDSLIIDDWNDGSEREHSTDQYLDYGTHRLRVEYYDDSMYAVARFWWGTTDEPNDYPDWKGEYWTNRGLDDDPRVTRNDRRVKFDWGNDSPDSDIPDDNFSARWTRWEDFDAGTYRFYAEADDGVRVWVGDDRIIDEWHDNSGNTTYSADIYLDGDERIKVEYYERTGGARIHVWWEEIGAATPTSTPGPVNPYVDVSPSEGGAGTSVAVSGGGFPANTRVNLYLGGIVRGAAISAADGNVYASATTDRRGTFSMNFTMPSNWPSGAAVESGRLVVLVATPDFSTEASAVFDFEATAATPTTTPTVSPDPVASIWPRSGGAGTRVTVTGGGFPGNTAVRVHLAGLVGIAATDSDPHAYASTTTDSNGNYSVAFNMPSAFAGGGDIETGKLLVTVATTDFTVVATTQFDYFVDAANPSADVQPSAGGAGTRVTVSGDGFPANTSLSLYLGTLDRQVGGGDEAVYATTVTDRYGNYSMAFTLSSNWPDGTRIGTGRLAMVVANSDFSIVVSGGFDYTAASADPTPTATATSTPVASPTAVRVPSMSISPGSGGPDTRVTVNGQGYPSNVTVSALLAKFEGGGGFADNATRYATTTTGADGSFSMSFRMPADWPDGSAITSGRVLVAAATNDFGALASATFRYQAASTSAVETVVPTPTVAPTVAAAGTLEPTVAPTATPKPPTATPTEEPTEAPTDTPEPPTATPTDEPTDTDTPEPPTATPTDVPNAAVTDEPTATDTPEPPTATPTDVPTAAATDEPTATDTPEPTTDTPEPPTVAPTDEPTVTPEPPTDTPEPPALAPTDEPTATPEPPTNTPEPPAPPPADEPTAVPEPPTATPEPPAEMPTVTPTVTPTPPEEPPADAPPTENPPANGPDQPPAQP